MASLERFIFSHNSFSGTLPTEIGTCARLDELQADTTSLAGSIPTEIGTAGDGEVRVLQLVNSHLSLGIPTEIGRQTAMNVFWLFKNSALTGTVPTELGSMKSMDQLSGLLCSPETPLIPLPPQVPLRQLHHGPDPERDWAPHSHAVPLV